jgi:hypothetical protein
VIAGRRNRVALEPSTFAVTVHAGPVTGRMAPALRDDMLVRFRNHEFMDNTYRRERTTFADGTTVAVDSDAGTVDVKPEVR